MDSVTIIQQWKEMFKVRLTEEDYRVLMQKNKTMYIKLEFLDRRTFNSYGTIKGNLIDYNFSIDGDSDYRRMFNASLVITENMSYLFDMNTTTFNWLVRPYIGLLDNKTQTVKWYLMGTFAFTDKSYTFVNSELQLNCVDMTAYLDGTLGGNIGGVTETTIYAYKDGSPYGLVKSTYVTEEKTVIATFFRENTSILLNVPYKILTKNSNATYQYVFGNRLGAAIDIHLYDYTGDVNKDLFKITGQTTNKIYYVKATNKDGEYVCSLTLPAGATDSQYLITPLDNINIYKINLFDKGIIDCGYANNIPLICYSFGRRIPIDNEDSSDDNNYSLTSITSSKEGFTGIKREISLQDLRYEIITSDNAQWYATRNINTSNFNISVECQFIGYVDATTGSNITLADTLKAILNESGITRYKIADDITEVIPYDQSFNVNNLSWFKVISDIIGLYDDIEKFFDINGTFVVQHIPTTEDETYVLSDDILKSLVIEEESKVDSTAFFNATEIFGNSIETDYYSANTETEVNVTYGENQNIITSTFNDINFDDDNNILTGTNFGIKMPENIENYKTNISVQINNANGNTVDTSSISVTKLWNITSESLQIIHNYSTSMSNVPLKYNGCVFYGEWHENANGVKYLNIWDTVASTSVGAGSNNLKSEIDGIEFINPITPTENSAWYIFMGSPKLKFIDATSTVMLDVNNLENCIQFTASKGEVVRFYYANYKLSVADSKGNILNKQISKINTDNKISYIDFYPIAEGTHTYYVFSKEASTIRTYETSVWLFGMSKFNYAAPSFPIKDIYTNENISAGFFKKNTSYTFKYDNGILWYLGQWQVHAVAIEVKEIPSTNDEYSKLLNCDNIIYTQYNPSLAVDIIGMKLQSLCGGEFDNIPNDGLAISRADWENWKAVRSNEELVLHTLFIPCLEPNTKVQYTSKNNNLKAYMINKISVSSDGTMSITLKPFYPRYKNISGYILRDDIDTSVLTNTFIDNTDIFSTSIYNYKLFDYKYYANNNKDLLNAYGYNSQKLWKHWCNYGIFEGRNFSKVYKSSIYKNNYDYEEKYVDRLRRIWTNTSNMPDNKLKNAAAYLHFLEEGIDNYNTICSDEFDIKTYSQYKDLRDLYGDNWRKYYEHFVKYNYIENKACI